MDAVDPIFIRDLEGKVIDLNRAAEHAYGWTREELIGKSIKTLVLPDLYAKAEEFHEPCKRGEKLENLEAVHVTKSGTTIPVLPSLSLIRNERDEPVGMVPKHMQLAAPVPVASPQGEACKAQQAPLERPTAQELSWWVFFTDSRLHKVIQMALNNNRDLRLSALNVKRARAPYGARRAQLSPAVDAVGAAGKQRPASDLVS